VYGIVQRDDGRIEVFSVQGQGTTFEISFPVTETFPAPADSSADAIPAARGHETIMIVDDEVDLGSLIWITLGERGHTVIEAADGIEAVKLFQASCGPIQLILIDLIMPRLGERETYMKWRELDPGIKALFPIGYGIDDETEDLLATSGLGAEGSAADPRRPCSVAVTGVVQIILQGP
jgi:hypothetical protein